MHFIQRSAAALLLAATACGPGYCSVIEIKWQSSLDSASVNHEYTGSLFGGVTGTWRFELSDGKLPAGIMLINNHNGGTLNVFLSGTPTESGTFHFKMKATSDECFKSDDHSFTLLVNP